MAMIWGLVILLVGLIYVAQTKLLKRNNKMKLPPGPIGFPIVGSLHLLGKLPHHNLRKLAQKYGPIMHIRLGLMPTIIVSTPQAAKLFLKTHDLVFASRPPLEAAKHMNWDNKNLAFAPYGSYWRDMRKLCTVELLSSVKISSFMGMRKEEMGLFIESLHEAAKVGNVVDLSAKISSLIADMSCRMVLGKKYSDVQFDVKENLQEVMHVVGLPNVADFIPFLAHFDIQGLTKRMKRLHKKGNDFIENIIDEKIQNNHEDGKSKDFISSMLSLLGSQQSEYQIEMSNIKAVSMDILAAAMDTSATTIEWAMSELIKKPRILKNLQEELEAVVGRKRVVEESDLEKLDYLDMVVKETLRLHPPGPLLIPHMATEDCTVNGYHIPRKSRVLINAYAIGRDPNAWENPETFIPERFVGSNLDVRGKDFQLIPFGAGRRGCPGLQLGLVVVKVVVANLTHCFNWRLPNDMPCSELDMVEEFGLTTPRANHLLVVPIYRLKK